jgi:hypothetical protein
MLIFLLSDAEGVVIFSYFQAFFVVDFDEPL